MSEERISQKALECPEASGTGTNVPEGLAQTGAMEHAKVGTNRCHDMAYFNDVFYGVTLYNTAIK
jgi:hypothetical protein